MTSHSETLLLRDIPHRSAHTLIGDSHESRSHLLDGVRFYTCPLRVDLFCKFLEFQARSGDIKGLVCVRTEDTGELGGDETAEDQVGIGDSERSAFTVTRWTGTTSQH